MPFQQRAGAAIATQVEQLGEISGGKQGRRTEYALITTADDAILGLVPGWQ